MRLTPRRRPRGRPASRKGKNGRPVPVRAERDRAIGSFFEAAPRADLDDAMMTRGDTRFDRLYAALRDPAYRKDVVRDIVPPVRDIVDRSHGSLADVQYSPGTDRRRHITATHSPRHCRRFIQLRSAQSKMRWRRSGDPREWASRVPGMRRKRQHSSARGRARTTATVRDHRIDWSEESPSAGLSIALKDYGVVW
jgi:hypothetical protein